MPLAINGIILYNYAGRCNLECTHREKGVDDVGLDGAERLVLNQNKDLLLFLQADEVTEPRPLSQPANEQVSDQLNSIHTSHISANELVYKIFRLDVLFLTGLQ